MLVWERHTQPLEDGRGILRHPSLLQICSTQPERLGVLVGCAESMWGKPLFIRVMLLMSGSKLKVTENVSCDKGVAAEPCVLDVPHDCRDVLSL